MDFLAQLFITTVYFTGLWITFGRVRAGGIYFITFAIWLAWRFQRAYFFGV